MCRPARTCNRAACIVAPIRARRPLPSAPHQRQRDQNEQQQQQRYEAEGEELLGARVEEVGGRDDDHAEHRQGDEVEQGLGYQGAEQHREGLPHAADAASQRHRPGRLAEAGRQGRRHQHADHRRRGDVAAADGRVGSAARTIQYQEAARKKSESAIRPQATQTQLRSERTMLSTTLSMPIFCAASGSGRLRSRQRGRARPGGRSCARACRAGGLGSSEGSRCGGRGGRPSEGAFPSSERLAPVVCWLGRRERPLVDGGHPIGDVRPGVALGALASGGPIAGSRCGSWWARCSSSARRWASPGGRGRRRRLVYDVAVASDRRGNRRGARGEGLGQDHAEALAREGRGAEHVCFVHRGV